MSLCPPPPSLDPGVRTIPGKVSLVVLNWNAQPFLERCLRSIVRHTPPGHQLVVVDNGSTDGSKGFVRDFLEERVPTGFETEFLDLPENLRFSRGFNLGFRAAARDAEFFLMICNDVEVKADGWLAELVAAMDDPRVIAAGHAQPDAPLTPEQRELYRRNAPHYADAALEERMYRAVDDPSFTYTHLYGYCFLLRRRHLERTGLYLEGGDFRQYHSDWEWYVRFQALGFEIASAPPRVHHWHSISELIEFHPHLYRDLLVRIDDPSVLERYVREGRPLYEEESGYREIQRQKRERERGGR